MSNWITDLADKNSGWAGCPHCRPEMRRIFLPEPVRSDMPVVALAGHEPIEVPAGVHEAEFNQHGAACVGLPNGRRLGVKPGEFRWLHPVPPYDRWCKGKGGLHK